MILASRDGRPRRHSRQRTGSSSSDGSGAAGRRRGNPGHARAREIQRGTPRRGAIGDYSLGRLGPEPKHGVSDQSRRQEDRCAENQSIELDPDAIRRVVRRPGQNERIDVHIPVRRPGQAPDIFAESTTRVDRRSRRPRSRTRPSRLRALLSPGPKAPAQVHNRGPPART